MRKNINRYIAGFLVGIMAITAMPALPVKAEETYEKVTAYDLEEMKKQILDSEDAKGYTNGAVTFPGAGTTMDVGTELVYHLFRQGNTDKEQTVTITTQDLTAGYGTDYEVVVDGEVVNGEANVLMNGKGVTYDVYLDGSQSLNNGDNTGGAEGNTTISDEEMENLEAISSSEFDLTFAPGEQLKELHVRAKTPKKAEAGKQFQFSVLKCKDGLEQGEYQTSVITLNETRDTEDAEVALVKGSAKVVDGYVTVLVERTGNTSEYTSYNLTAENGTAVNGEDFILKSSQLLFSPGVSRQRVHIPLVSADKKEVKTFTLHTDDSEEEVSYQTTTEAVRSTFNTSRELVDISMADFEKGEATKATDDVSFFKDSDHNRYKFGFSSYIGSGSERNASIKTVKKYDFTGIEKVRFSGSYAVGTVEGDYLNVYVSNEDYAHNEAMFASLKNMKIGDHIGTLSLTGQGIHEFNVDCTGMYYLYMTAQQHTPVFGAYIGYYLYDQNYGKGDEGHPALVKKKYNLQAQSPRELGGKVPVSDVTLTLSSDSTVNGRDVDVYRDESFQISYTQLDENANYAGYQLQDSSGNVYYTCRTSNPTFTLSSEIIAKYEDKFKNDTIYISPIFEYDETEVKILKQDFSNMGNDALKAEIDEKTGVATYYDSGTVVAKVTWKPEYATNSTLIFNVEENKDYHGEYHFTAFKECNGSSSSAVTNPVYHTSMNSEWSLKLEKEYYEITPMISNKNARLLLNVSGVSHGRVDGIPEDFTGDEYTVEDYDEKGNYKSDDIVIFAAKPKDGYRAKWSYRDVATGQTKTYYGSMFYYRVQVPMLLSDNYVSLIFEPCENQVKRDIVAEVYMQGGDLLHEPQTDSDVYTPLEGASVSIEGITKSSESDGKAGPFEINAAPGETYTALVMANNRQYIQDVVIPSSTDTSICQKMKLSYYYEGPRVTSVRYYSFDGTIQNGDTIYLSDNIDSVILATEIEKAGKNITDVIYKLKDSEGTLKGEEHVAERNGSEYIWSAQLGLEAQEGDQIWVELIEEKEDKNGKKTRTSYGEVNTGYSIVKAEYTSIDYIPNIGVDQEFQNVPFFGSLYTQFLVFGGVTPTFSASMSNGVTYLTIGLSFTLLRDRKNKTWSVQNPKKYLQQVAGVMKVLSDSTKGVDKVAAQKLSKKTFSFNAACSLQLALYSMVNENTKNSQLVVVGGWMTFGIGGTFAYNCPVVINGIPLFANMSFGVNASDTFSIMSTDNRTGYVNLEAMSDPSSSSFKPDNDFKAEFPATIYLGAGVNGIADIAGGGNVKILLDWVDWSYGVVKMNLALQMKVELLVFGGSLGWNVVNLTLYDNNPYKSANEQTETQLMNEKLSTFKLKTADLYQQSVNATSDGAVVTDAYEFSRPQMYPMGDNKYMMVMSVNNQEVADIGTSEESAQENRPVLAYAIYDATTKSYQTGQDGKIFRSLEPDAGENGRSINFHPSITKIGDSGKYLITWNSILYHQDTEQLNLANTRTVVRAAVYDSREGKIETYKSLVTEDENDNLMSDVVLDTAYDEKNQEVVVLYRAMNLEGLDENSKLIDYARVGSTLMCTSLKLDGKKDTNFSESVEIASGGTENGAYNIIKTADLEMMNGKPMISYQTTEGEQANLLSTAEEGSRNHIYLSQLKHKEAGGYEIAKSMDIITEDALKDVYHAQPQLLSYTKDGKEYNLLMWRTEHGIASVDPAKYLADPENYKDENTAVLTSELASSMGDYQVIQGEDGKVYSIWIEGKENGTGNTVKMAALESVTDETVSWGRGSTVFETDDYIQALSPNVDSNGVLHAIYRNTSAKDMTKSNIVLKNIDLSEEKLQVENYANISDEKKAEYEGIGLTNLGLEVSDLFPTAGEKLTIKGRVKNNGVNATKKRTFSLYVNGQNTGQTEEVPILCAGMEKELTFTYQVPDNYDGKSKLTFSLSGDSGTEVTQETSTGARVEVSDLDFKELTYLEEDSDTVSFNVKASITNTGNDVSEPTTLAISQLQCGKENEEDTLLEDMFGTCDVPAIKPGESKTVRFRLDIPKQYFEENIVHVANIAVAIYSNYGQENQILEELFSDAIKAEEVPEVTTLTVEKIKKVGVKQSLCLNAKVEPKTAQEFAGLTYESSDPSIATVDKNGIVAGIKKGTCTITVTTKNGLKKTVTIQVTKDAVDDNDNKKDPTDQPDANGGGGSGSNGNGSGTSANPGSGQKSNAKTGDNSPVLPMSILFVLCGMVIACEVVSKKRKNS